VRAISILLLVGIFTPAIRAIFSFPSLLIKNIKYEDGK